MNIEEIKMIFTVKDLIEELKKHGQDKEILIHGYEGKTPIREVIEDEKGRILIVEM